MRNTSAILHTLTITLVLQALSVVSANADIFTGCLTQNGTLKNLAAGPSPLKPCDDKSTQVTIGDQLQFEALHPELASQCPCNYFSTLHWAWASPDCFHFIDIPEPGDVFLGVTDDDLTPSVLAVNRPRLAPLDLTCNIQSPSDTTYQRVDGLSVEQYESCLSDLNKIAIMLGDVEGCELP